MSGLKHYTLEDEQILKNKNCRNVAPEEQSINPIDECNLFHDSHFGVNSYKSLNFAHIF